MSAITQARPGIAVPGLTIPGLDAPSGPVKALSTATVTDPRDGTATVS